jgi:hypothetical protein
MISRSTFYHLLPPATPFRMRATMKVSTADPTIDQIIGKVFPPTLMANISGRPNFPAIHIPIYAPIKPTTIETRHPPRSNPASAWPTEPQTAAIIRSTSNSVSVIVGFMRKYYNLSACFPAITCFLAEKTHLPSFCEIFQPWNDHSS